MKIRDILTAGAVALAPTVALADSVQGLYISLGAGDNWMGKSIEYQDSAYQFAGNPGLNLGVRPAGNVTHDNGFVLNGAVGWGFGNNIRAELEVAYRQNHLSQFVNAPNIPIGNTYTPGSYEKKTGFMANVYYDFNNIGSPIVPYVGAGVGLSIIDWSDATRTAGSLSFGPYIGTTTSIAQSFNTNDVALTTQAIVGASYNVDSVPGLALTSDFRVQLMPQGFSEEGHLLFHGSGPAFQNGILTSPSGMKFRTEWNYALMIGARYSFGAPAPSAAPMAPAAMAAAPAALSRSYIVFFDWDKATLTDRARQIVAEAATNSTKVQYTSLEVNGYTDTSGTPQYNKGLSLHRAEAVAAELVKDGVPKNAITIQGFGETHPLVPTAPGVREPQNRRVEIIIK